MKINIFFKELFSFKSQIVKIVFGICLYRNMKLLSPIFVNCILAMAVCHIYIHFFFSLSLIIFCLISPSFFRDQLLLFSWELLALCFAVRQTFAILWSRYLWLGVTLNQQKNKHDAQKLFRQGEQQQARVNYIVADDYFSELPRMR